MSNRKPAPEGPVARLQSAEDQREHLHRMIDQIDERAQVYAVVIQGNAEPVEVGPNLPTQVRLADEYRIEIKVFQPKP